MSQDTKAKLANAKRLIKAKQFDLARDILVGIDDPIATRWLIKLDQIAPEPKPKSKPSQQNRQLIYVGGGILALLVIVIAVVLTATFVNNNNQPNDEQDVSSIATAMIEVTSTPIPEPTSEWTYSNTLDNPLPANEPIVYDTGTLQILEVHQPVGFALYSGDNRSALTNNNEYVGIKFSFQCRSVCERPPEATLSLISSNGSEWDVAPVFALVDEMLYSSDNNVGWLYFQVESASSLSALHITNDETSLFVSLPNPINGYFVDASWKALGDDGQTLRIPELRRLLDSQYAVDDVVIGSTNDFMIVFVPVVFEALYFESNQQVIDTAFPIITTVADRWDDYRQDVDGITISLRRATDHNITATVFIESAPLGDYADGNITTNELINSASIDIRESPPTLGQSGTNQQSTSATDVPSVPPTSTPNISVQNAVDVPQTKEGFEQYLLSNYSSIAGQSLSIKRITVSDDYARYVTIDLIRDSGGWETFANQTRASATDYAKRLIQDVESFFGTEEDILVSVSYSYYTDDLKDYHYDDEWWYIGDYTSGKGWYVSQDFVSAFYYDGSWELDVWNYR